MQCLCEQAAGPDVRLSPVCIGSLWLFENLKPGELKTLGETALRKVYEPGDPVFHQGDPASDLFIIKGGRIRLAKVMEDGTELTLDLRKAGDFVGETVLSDEAETYPVSAYCMEKTLTCGFTKAQFESIILQMPNVGLQVIKNMSQRITSLTGRVTSMAGTSIENRLYRVLVNVAREHGVKDGNGTAIAFPLTHEDLGFLIGAHRVSVTRAIKSLKESGKIRIQGKTLVLPTSA